MTDRTYSDLHAKFITDGRVSPAELRVWISRGFLSTQLIPTVRGKRRVLTDVNIYEIGHIHFLRNQGLGLAAARRVTREIFNRIVTGENPQLVGVHQDGRIWVLKPSTIGTAQERKTKDALVIYDLLREQPGLLMINPHGVIRGIDKKLEAFDAAQGAEAKPPGDTAMLGNTETAALDIAAKDQD